MIICTGGKLDDVDRDHSGVSVWMGAACQPLHIHAMIELGVALVIMHARVLTTGAD